VGSEKERGKKGEGERYRRIAKSWIKVRVKSERA
jgi:hypothetical protein